MKNALGGLRAYFEVFIGVFIVDSFMIGKHLKKVDDRSVLSL